MTAPSAPDPRQVAPPHAERQPDTAPPFDPLRLCVFATVALLGWLLGPVALLGFAVLAIVGYARARRGGLLRSRCKLGDTRLVLLYLSALAAAACVGIYFWIT
ncbi:hypothetical protein SAMN04489867_2226 [Pedococcus dokdonensis]|uniref:Uncharacterized protein n=1 Tax=Pedococcus dokdonensis TaxID=443156 RepID=A0A1H0S6J5_9MICO|nr:hypothetical protein [Pedococcus dokdonensis]SDP37287.1 hypothetical protein SAMN04489867_2226 [Pedococcus dokdonensis]